MIGARCRSLPAAPTITSSTGGRLEAAENSFERQALCGVEEQQIQDAGPANEAASSGEAPCLARQRALERPSSEAAYRARGESAPGALLGSLDAALVREALGLSVYEKCTISVDHNLS